MIQCDCGHTFEPERQYSHYIICGDCTDKAVVAKLMSTDAGHVTLIVTDPPYGVSYADKNKFLNAIGRPNRIETEIAGDHQTVEEMSVLWKSAFTVAHEVAQAGCAFYTFAAQGGDLHLTMMMAMRDSGWQPRHSLIWVKNNHVLGRADYNYKHEPILYAWKEGGHKFYGGFQTSVLEVDKPTKSDLHPTTKPVELVERLVSNSSQPGEIVFDPFLGSGTTLVAAERLGRIGRGVEIVMPYTAVCLERLSDMGLIPRLVDNPNSTKVTNGSNNE